MFPDRLRKVCVISLDGVPGTLLRAALADGWMPALRALWDEGGEARLRSTLPPLSSVAWASYATGTDAGHHGVYGFVDRVPETMRQRVLSSRDVAVPAWWARLGQAGRPCVVINVPLTWPVQEMRGALVAGFPAPDMARGAHPPELAARLAAAGYLVDPDPRLAGQPVAMLAELRRAVEDKRRVALELLEEPWVVFHLHIMATDRLHHFFFQARTPGNPHHEAFRGLYELIGETIAEIVTHLPRHTELLMLSDHGFCDLRWELDLNAFLADEELLYVREQGMGPARVMPESHAYALTPGRIYWMRRGRELGARLTEAEIPALADRVGQSLEGLRTPSGQHAIAEVIAGARAYQGPTASLSPDLVVLPADGVELAAGWDGGALFRPAQRQGGHTLEGAFVWARGRRLRDGAIPDVTATLWARLGMEAPPVFSGKDLVAP